MKKHRKRIVILIIKLILLFSLCFFIEKLGEFEDEDTAWGKAEAISRFEKDFANAYRCIVNKDGEIELCVTGKDTLQTYQLFRGELGKTTLGLGLRVVKPHQTFKLPEQAHECIQHINSII